MNRRTQGHDRDAHADAQPREFAGKEGGQDITARQATKVEKAEVLTGVASVSDHQMLSVESPDELVVRMLRMNPEFSAAPQIERERMALELMEVFDTLEPDEARTALALYTNVMEIGACGGAWTGTLMDMVQEEHREAVSDILAAEREERAAVRRGEAKMAGTQLPLLVAAHAKEIVKSARYAAERRAFEEGVWSVDEDIAAKGRAALNAVFGIGNAFAEGAEILAGLSPKRAQSEGLSGAISELCRFWQAMRENALDERDAPEAIVVFSWFHDQGMPPSMKGLMVISELSSMNCSVTDPAESIISALKRISGRTP